MTEVSSFAGLKKGTYLEGPGFGPAGVEVHSVDENTNTLEMYALGAAAPATADVDKGVFRWEAPTEQRGEEEAALARTGDTYLGRNFSSIPRRSAFLPVWRRSQGRQASLKCQPHPPQRAATASPKPRRKKSSRRSTSCELCEQSDRDHGIGGEMAQRRIRLLEVAVQPRFAYDDGETLTPAPRPPRRGDPRRRVANVLLRALSRGGRSIWAGADRRRGVTITPHDAGTQPRPLAYTPHRFRR